jgi:hypothetical protein
LKLAGSEATAVAAHPSDLGVALESFDRPRRTAASVAAAVREAPPTGDSIIELRRLSHKLRPALRVDRPFGEAWMTGRRSAALAPRCTSMVTAYPMTSSPRELPSQVKSSAWGIGFLLTVGMLTLLAGVASLAWSTAYGDPLASQWGVTASMAGEGLLVIALARITLRLWRNSRRLVAQLEGMRGHLEQLERHGGPLPFGCGSVATVH